MNTNFFIKKIKIRVMESECEIKYININKTRFMNSFFSTFGNQFLIIIFKMIKMLKTKTSRADVSVKNKSK